MQMRHGLTGALLAIDDQAVAVADAEFVCQASCHEMEMPQEFLVFLPDVGMRAKDLARNDQHVHRRLGVNVAKCQAEVVLVNNGRRDLAVENLLKDIVLHHGHALCPSSHKRCQDPFQIQVSDYLTPSGAWI